MKTITLKSRWIDRVDPVTTEEYPAGWSGEVTDDRAARAKRAGVLAPAPKKAAD
jgi:hypothetical protein